MRPNWQRTATSGAFHMRRASLKSFGDIVAPRPSINTTTMIPKISCKGSMAYGRTKPPLVQLLRLKGLRQNSEFTGLTSYFRKRFQQLLRRLTCTNLVNECDTLLRLELAKAETSRSDPYVNIREAATPAGGFAVEAQASSPPVARTTPEPSQNKYKFK